MPYDNQPMNKSLNLIKTQLACDLLANKKEEPVVKTPLVKAVTHLLKIGSTTQSELQEMAAEFITEKDACLKLGIVYENWLFDQFARDLNNFREKLFEKASHKKVRIKFSVITLMTLQQSKAWLYSESVINDKILGCEFEAVEKQKQNWLFEEV